MVNNILIVTIFISALILLLWQISNLVAIFSGCLYVSANRKNVQKVLQDFARPNLIFYDLGCGNSNILLLADDLKMKATGYEIAPFYYLLSWLLCLGRKNIKIKYQNILHADISRADIIYCYLLPPLLEKLSKKFTREIKNDAIVISAGFPLQKLKLIKEYNINNRKYFAYKNNF